MSTARESAKKIISENISGRKLVFIESFVKLEQYLEENNIHVDIHVTLDKEKINNDFNWICSNLPDIAPKSIGGYKRMINTNSSNYQKLVSAAKEKGYVI